MSDQITGDPRRAFQFLDLNDRGDKPRSTGVTENPEYSARFPEHMVCDVRIHAGGEVYETHKEDYEGFHTKPMSWDTVSEKFARLAEPYTGAVLRNDLISAVKDLETIPASDLFSLLSTVDSPDA